MSYLEVGGNTIELDGLKVATRSYLGKFFFISLTYKDEKSPLKIQYDTKQEAEIILKIIAEKIKEMEEKKERDRKRRIEQLQHYYEDKMRNSIL